MLKQRDAIHDAIPLNRIMIQGLESLSSTRHSRAHEKI
jgi:hypothetical protein